MGGLNVARRIFRQITSLYDEVQERYHVVNRVSMMGGGHAQIPFGYLVLLAAKHFEGTRPLKDTDENWNALLRLSSDYAAFLDVQNYVPTAWFYMDAKALLPYLQELALYDTLFRIPQIRGSDISRIARGVLREFDFEQKLGTGWTLNDALTVIEVLMDQSRGHRGPVSFDLRRLKASCGKLEPAIIAAVLDEALCHPSEGPNRLFSKPTDAPTSGAEGKEIRHNFVLRPLLSRDHKTYWLLDRSTCAPACLEALFTVLRKSHKDFDGRRGTPIEAFLREQLAAQAVPTLSGKYVVDGEDGECDIVVETAKTIIFMEVKKKPLTRRAQAGSDAHVLLDLANSLLAAQVQAGWHEVRLRKHGFIELDDNGTKTRLELNGRGVERIAVSLMQFGSFQDRILLKQFLEATLRAVLAGWSSSAAPSREASDGVCPSTSVTCRARSTGTVTLDEAIFGIQPNVPVLHQVVTAQLAAARSGTQSTKTRAEVSGGGKKPFKQKGTGRARQGSERAPHFTGGGVALGPKPRSYRQRTPRKMIQLALRSALSDRAAEGRVVGRERRGRGRRRAPRTPEPPWTRSGLDGQGAGGADPRRRGGLQVLPQPPGVQLLLAGELNAYDILCNDWIVFTPDTLPGESDVTASEAPPPRRRGGRRQTSRPTRRPGESTRRARRRAEPATSVDAAARRVPTPTTEDRPTGEPSRGRRRGDAEADGRADEEEAGDE